MIFKKIFPSILLGLFLLSPGLCFSMQKGDMLIPFSGITMQGKQINMGTIIGTEPVMLVFWASWCPNCAREIPEIDRLLLTEGGKDLRVITINVGINDSEARARKFMDKTGLDYPVIFDAESVITRQHGIMGVPTILIADRRGAIVYRQHVVPDEAKLLSLLPLD